MNKKLIRKMQTASGGPINYKRWDNAKITSYNIPFIKEKAIKLTNAGRATGAVLSTNLLDSLADNAMRAGVPVRTAIGVSTKETTLGNPTDTKSAWNLSSGIRREFNGKYPGTHLHINPGRGLNERELVINYHKGHLLDTNTLGKSVILEALEFYKQHPDKYNTNQSDYQNLVNIIGEEVMKSPEILKWYREWEKSKAQIFRPEPYKINTNIQNTALEFVPYNKQGGKMNIIKLFKEGGRVRKMQTAAGGGFASLITTPVLPNIKEIRRRLYNGVNPSGYQHIPERVWDALNKKKANRAIYRDDLWATYLQIPEKERHSGVEKLQPARYKPSMGNISGDIYRMPLNEEDADVLIQRALLSGLGLGKNMVDRSLAHYFGDHTVGRGHDKKGEYISYYDKYDLNQFAGGTPVKTGIKSVDKWLKENTSNIDMSMGIGKPFELYDRIYLDDYYGIPEEARGGNFLPEVTVTGKKKQGGKMNILEFLKNGSGIHIKEKNKGKFTSYCGGKVTDECILKGKNSSNPVIRKRATFAANARKWKHLDGGIIRKMKTAAGGPIEKIPEVVITPDKNTKILGNNIRGIIKDPVLRNNFYKYILNSDEYRNVPYISDNEKILRFINLYKKSGNPKIHVISPHGRPYYIGGIPFMNDIYASTSYYDNEKNNTNIVAELSHAYQYNNNYAKQLKLKPRITKELKQRINKVFNEDEAYDKVGNIEYDAHSIIEPAMHEYISGSTDNFEKYLKDFTNEVRSYPKYYSSGVDKFASYYKKGGIIKAEDGTKFNWQSALTNMGTNLFSSYLQSRVQNNKINSAAEAAKAENEVDLNQYFWDIYLQELAKALLEEELKSKAISAMNDTVINSSPLVTLKIAYDKASKSYGNLKTTLDARNKAIDAQAEAAKSSVITDAVSGVIQNGLGMLKDYYGSKNNNTSTSSSTTSNSYFDNYVNTKYKKFGTFNSDGSMNMLGGTFTIKDGYKPNQPQLYQPLKLNV